MSYKIHPKFFRAYYYKKRKQAYKNKFCIELSKVSSKNPFSFNFLDKLHDYFKMIFKQDFRRRSLYVIDSFFFYKNNNLIIVVSLLSCVKGPELVKIRKRKPKFEEKKKKKPFIFDPRKFFDAIKYLISFKNIWFKCKFCKLGPLMEVSLEKKKSLQKTHVSKISKETVKMQNDIFYSLKNFSNTKFFQEFFCVLNTIILNHNDNISMLVDYITYYFKKTPDHKSFYKFIVQGLNKYSNLKGAKKTKFILQVKGRFSKTKRTKKRLSKTLEEYSLSRLSSNCIYAKGFAITKTGCFGVRLWTKILKRS